MLAEEAVMPVSLQWREPLAEEAVAPASLWWREPLAKEPLLVATQQVNSLWLSRSQVEVAQANTPSVGSNHQKSA